MRVLFVFGTRPEAIKLAPVIHALRAQSAFEAVRVCVTGQHRDMLDQTLAVFGITADHDLDVMLHQQSLSHITADILTKLGPVLGAERPDWVLVQGDTTTAMVASLAAFYHRVRVGHVEAGLRTHDKWAPFPEEGNRRIADVLADLHFAPTADARENLLREGVSPETILVTGNTVIDALHWAAATPVPDGVESLVQPGRRLILVTAHRRESFGAPLEGICHGLREVAERYADSVQIIFPVHRNPNVQEPVHRLLSHTPNIQLIPPADYLTLVHLMKRAHLIATDSGGIQEEAPSLGVPVLVLRDVTERPEAVAAGAVRVVGTSRERLVHELARLLDDAGAREAMASPVSPYGDGRASARIATALLERRRPLATPAAGR